TRRPPRPTLFPYTTLFRSKLSRRDVGQMVGDLETRLGDVDELRGKLAELEDMQRRLGELEERVDFAERLLTKQRDAERLAPPKGDRKSTRLNSSHLVISYA